MTFGAGIRHWVLLAALGGTGCGRAASWVEQASFAHGQADRAIAQGDVEGACVALEAFAARTVPAIVLARDRRVVLQDVLYRLSGLYSADHPKAALDAAERGLRLGESADVFTASLWVSQGRALEQLGDDRGAARAYANALKINDALLRAAEGQP
jgi:hypothetical protein